MLHPKLKLGGELKTRFLTNLHGRGFVCVQQPLDSIVQEFWPDLKDFLIAESRGERPGGQEFSNEGLHALCISRMTPFIHMPVFDPIAPPTTFAMPKIRSISSLGAAAL
ncbi:hypothetical protein BOTBODRAFT_32872 [Botryobasidium botryosum FD-172 SS1]|uniref:Uncharacterized protein n=1 Tax=Botryobasidium botryosum (strain FD-172 SS1) TaxID=930990 RepID=A0A067MEV3_BOTB1|nr:hypothetical protein BOTBODRAFT_32872 [Botryobasidium botryosum FD-172 SS1]